MSPRESARRAEAPGRAGQGGAATMDGLAEDDLRNDKREEPAARGQAVAVLERLRPRIATHERG